MDHRGTQKGPDDQAGTVFGAGWDAVRRPAASWVIVAPGVWMHHHDSSPQACVRPVLPGGLRQGHGFGWQSVQGLASHHRWIVPALLRLRVTNGAVELQPGIDPILTPAGWEEPPHLADIALRVRSWLGRAKQYAAGEAEAGDVAKEMAELAIDLLMLGHFLSREELLATGWLSQEVCNAVLLASMCLTPECVEEMAEACP